MKTILRSLITLTFLLLPAAGTLAEEKAPRAGSGRGCQRNGDKPEGFGLRNAANN